MKALCLPVITMIAIGSYGQSMKVYTPTGTQSFPLSSIDSITFDTNTVGTTVPTAGLVAYYPFSGNANDISGSGNNGTVNNATLTTDRFGSANAAYHFNGTTAYIDCGNNASLRPAQFTISAWAKTDVISICQGPGNCGNVVIQYTPPTYALGEAWSIHLYAITSGDSDNLPVFSMWAPSTGAQCIGGSGTCTPPEPSSSPITASQWYHYCGTYDGTTQTFYINGVLIGSRTSTLSYTGLDRVLIGASKGTSTGALSAFWQGTIDDVRIYSRALSSSEVLSLYHEGGW